MSEKAYKASAVMIRDATLEDSFAVEAIRVVSWRNAFRGLIPGEFLDSMDIGSVSQKRIEQGFPRLAYSPASFTIVAEDEGEVVGYAMAGPPVNSQDTPTDGEIIALYILPELLDTGVGSALMKEVFERFRT